MEVRVLNSNPYYDYREMCFITLGKSITEEKCNEEIFEKDMLKFWKKHIIANHSTLRCLHFRIIDKRPKSVVMQIIRATKGHPQPEVQSSRPDWTGEERSKDPYEEKLFSMDFTPESFLAMCEQRLCSRTEKMTRQTVQSWVFELRESENPLLRAIGELAVPQCVKFGNRCPELKPCGRFDNFEI